MWRGNSEFYLQKEEHATTKLIDFIYLLSKKKKRGEHEEMSERDKTERKRENGRELLQIASQIHK